MTHADSYLRALLRAFGVLSLCALQQACLEPQKDDGMLYSSYVLSAGAKVPRLEDDMGAGKKLDANDGFSGSLIPLRTGYVAGKEAKYWDLGQVAALAAKPMWIFRRQGDGSSEEIGHPSLIDSIPGDTPYTPLRQLYVVLVTDAYHGQVITSERALEDAIDLKIVEAPVPQDHFVNCVVTLSTMQRQVGPDMTDVVSPEPAYYRGKIVYQFCIGGFENGVGALPLNMDGTVTAGNAYLVRRVNEGAPLDEATFKADFNADEDMLDSNTVFDSNVRDMKYTSVWKSIDVQVPAEYNFGDAKAESDLFTKMSGQLIGKSGKVVQFKDNLVFLNRPIQPETP
jgi:hypothetical protein